MTTGGCETATAEMADRCEGPCLPSETVPQRNSSPRTSPSSSSRRRFGRTIVLNVGGKCHHGQVLWGLFQRFCLLRRADFVHSCPRVVPDSREFILGLFQTFLFAVEGQVLVRRPM